MIPQHRRWRSSEEAVLRRWWKKLHHLGPVIRARAIAARMQRSWQAVVDKALRMGLHKTTSQRHLLDEWRKPWQGLPHQTPTQLIERCRNGRNPP